MSGFGSSPNIPNGPRPILGFGTSSNSNPPAGFPGATSSTGLSFGVPVTQTFASAATAASSFPVDATRQQATGSIFGSSSTLFNNNPMVVSSNSGVFGSSSPHTATKSTGAASGTFGTLGFGTSTSLVKPYTATSSSIFSTGGGGVETDSFLFSGTTATTITRSTHINTFSTVPNKDTIFGPTTTPFSQGSSLTAFNTAHSSLFPSDTNNSAGQNKKLQSPNNTLFGTSNSMSFFPNPPPFQNKQLFTKNSSIEQPFSQQQQQQQHGKYNSGFGSSMSQSKAFESVPPLITSSSNHPLGRVHVPLDTSMVVNSNEFNEEDNMMGMYGTPVDSNDIHVAETQREHSMMQEQKEEELARLKAKIQEKRKLLIEKKQRFEASSSANIIDSSSSMMVPNAVASTVSQSSPFMASLPRKLNPEAGSFHPTKIRNEENTTRDMDQGGSQIIQLNPPPKPRLLLDDDNDDLDRDLRPVNMTESLIGTCPYMCPEEEWLRREREGDIQILEMPHSSIYPHGWTIRETSVKRFRRSAADFKLDIPSLVRPPHVLERVCAYLEEWVMERDRQGVDPRYVLMGKGNVPPPLDVYQFIWDRTRMVRKDFILQNFVGTGGRCSATAVRVHERIARWHAMCEHQLSHLVDFIPQSQQNIQELGQTMKTLNLYYDDVLGRSTKEEDHYEYHQHGCQSSVVMGPCPTDYNGSPMDNSPQFAQVHQRLIGFKDVTTSATSEPEMRALYILLTANNDGGMEVIKYAGRLSVERPDVFKSAPVKLAMEIFKAKKEYNYAKFFALLKDPSTPYLFACVMFKYVEQMREVAFRMMSKTFGSRKKDTLENTCDSYPLSELVLLLCFEDDDEATYACSHYNIMIETINNVDTIMWKKSEFCKPKDPIKGITLHLRPRKMIRTIESKLHGATRLSVCRGDLSDIVPRIMDTFIPKREEAELVQAFIAPMSQSNTMMPNEPQIAIGKSEPLRREENEAVNEHLAFKEQLRAEAEKHTLEKAMLKEQLHQEELRRLHNEERRKEEAVRFTEMQTAELMRLQAAEQETLLHKANEEKREQERQLQLVELQNKEKETRRMQELMDKELRDRMEDERRQRLAVEETRKQQEAEKQIRDRKEQERRQRLADEEIRKQREKDDETRKLEVEWVKRISTARKVLVLKKWLREVDRSRLKNAKIISLQYTSDPISSRFPLSPPIVASDKERKVPRNLSNRIFDSSTNFLEQLFYCIGTNTTIKIDFLSIFLRVSPENLSSLRTRRCNHTMVQAGDIILIKIGFIVYGDSRQSYLSQLIQIWVDSRVQSSQSDGISSPLRVIVVNCTGQMGLISSCDAALIVIMPGNEGSSTFPSSHLQSLVDSDIPRVILNLDTNDYVKYTQEIGQVISDLSRVQGCCAVLHVDNMPLNEYQLDDDLFQCFAALIEECVQRSTTGPSTRLVEKIPMHSFIILLFRKVLLSSAISESDEVIPARAQRSFYNERNEQIYNHFKFSVSLFLDEIESLRTKLISSIYQSWPSEEFLDSKRCVPLYFSDRSNLPSAWLQSLDRMNIDRFLRELIPSVFQSSCTLFNLLDDFIDQAPDSLKHECVYLLQNERLHGVCERALEWIESHNAPGPMMYLPIGEITNIIDRICIRLFPSLSSNTFAYVPPQVQVKQDFTELVATEIEEVVSGLESSQAPGPCLSIISPVLSPLEKRGITTQSKKRNRIEPNDLPDEVEASKAFTAKLQTLLNEEAVLDMKIGTSSLSSILLNRSGPTAF